MLSKTQVSQIKSAYIEDMKKTLRPGQEDKPVSYWKRCAESKMKDDAGHVFIANAIWEIGLPRVPHFATELRVNTQLSAQDLEELSRTIQSVLDWLDRVAVALLNHHTTPEYKEALRKSGIAHGQTGLSATEQQTRATNRKAKSDVRTAEQLAKQWKNRELTYNNCSPKQYELLEAYWDGSLEARLKHITSADTMCRTLSLAHGSATEQTIH